MSKIILVLGGARSGKSSYALEIAKAHKKVVFIATAEANDQEMLRRIQLHKKVRPRHWHTIEEPVNIAAVLKKSGDKYDCLIIDCLTLLVSNLILQGFSQEIIKERIEQIISILKKYRGTAIIVSNEVGLGIVPNNKLGREFRDLAGLINQIFARDAHQVIFMISGIPWRIK